MDFKITPFVKWVGGKRQLLDEIKKRIPRKFNDYYEPFVGGGALLFEIKPKSSFINDINSFLINTYQQIKEKADDVINALSYLDNKFKSKEDYYTIRNTFNEKITNIQKDVEAAALFIYLNKRSFNGVYRVNSKGLFNVPFNNKIDISSFDEKNIKNISSFLKQVNIFNKDFETVLENAKKDDFIFFDSPYVPLNKTSFNSYTSDGFSYRDHVRLANLFKKLHKKGCYLMLTNHDTELIRNLYSEFNIEIVDVKRLVNSDSSNRKGKEVIITNYKNEGGSFNEI